MKPVNALKKARKRLEDPKKWTQDGLFFEGAKCCAIGALAEVAQIDPWTGVQLPGEIFLQRALPEGYRLGVTSYNDNPTTTHGDILALYDRAIELAEAS